MYVLQNYNELVDEADIKVIKANSQRLSLNTDIKFVSKVRGQLCDSRKSYIASVTIHPEGRQFHATDKI